MKNLYLFFAALALLLTPSAHVWAAGKTAVVDVAKILSESEAAKGIQKKLKARQESFLEDLGKQEKELRDLEKEIVENKSKLSPDDFNKKRKEFEEKHQETRKNAQEERRKIDRAASKANATLIKKLSEIVQSIAEEKEYETVLSNQAVLFHTGDMDITDEAIKKLNKEVKSIDLDID